MRINSCLLATHPTPKRVAATDTTNTMIDDVKSLEFARTRLVSVERTFRVLSVTQLFSPSVRLRVRVSVEAAACCQDITSMRSMGAMFSRGEEGAETTAANEIVLGAPIWGGGQQQAKRHYRVGMATAQMKEDVRMYLLGDAVFKARGSKLESLGFRRCIDYPDLPSHVYYEGYFHTFASSPHKSVRSLNPRGGWPMDKPPAPPRLLAFAEAFRRCNADTLARVAALSPTLLKMHESGAFFADVAVQMHWGAEVSGERLGWHRDAPNSVIHLALGLAGHRTLHTCTVPISDTADEDGDDDTADVHRPQHPGDVYMSSPFTFYHAVEYPRATWQSRIIAIQMRLAIAIADEKEEGEGLVSTPSYTDLSDACSVDNKEDLFAAIAAALVSKPLAVPTLDEVVEVEKELGGATAT